MTAARAEQIGTPKKWEGGEGEEEEEDLLPPPLVTSYTPASSPGKLYTETENEWHAKFDKLQEAFQVRAPDVLTRRALPLQLMLPKLAAPAMLALAHVRATRPPLLQLAAGTNGSARHPSAGARGGAPVT